MKKKKTGLLVLLLLLIFQLSGFSWAVIYRPEGRDTRPWLPRERITRTAGLGLYFEDYYLKKENRHYSYLIQEYSLGLQGPLVSPLFGRGNLTLRYGQRNPTSKLSKVSNAKQLYYSFSGNLLPPRIRQFVNLSVNLAKTDMDDNYCDPRSLRSFIYTTSQVNLGVALPPLTFGGNNNRSNIRRGTNTRSRNNNRGLRIPLPSFNYSYNKSNYVDQYPTQQFIRDVITQNYNISYKLSPFSIQISHGESETVNPLREQVIGKSSWDRGIAEMVFLNPVNLSRIGIKTFISKTKYELREDRRENRKTTLEDGITNSNEIITKSVTLLKITSNLNYTNTNSYGLPNRSGQIGHSLSLNSGYPLPLPGLSLNNQVGYARTSPFPVGQVSESSYENIGLNYGYRLPATDVSAWARKGFTWVKKGDKSASEDYGGQIYQYFGNWAFLFLNLSYTTSDNLNRKETISRIIGNNLRIHLQPDLLLRINGNNNRNNRNGRNGRNGIFNLTDFSSAIEYQFNQEKNLLTSAITRWDNSLLLNFSKGIINHLLSSSGSMRWDWFLDRSRRENLNLGLSASPFNNYNYLNGFQCLLNVTYAQDRWVAPGSVSTSRGVNLGAESRIPLIHRLGLSTKINHSITWNSAVTKRTDFYVGSDYAYGLTTFNLNWNLYDLGKPDEYHTFQLKFLRNF